MTKTIRELAADLAAGRITSVALTQQMLARAEAHRAQGIHAYLARGDQARRIAAIDSARAAGWCIRRWPAYHRDQGLST